MKLLVISHKETWADPGSPSGYATIGGFPFQMAALSELFDQTTLLVLERHSQTPLGSKPLVGHNLNVITLPEPMGRDLRRKLSLLTWLPRHLPAIWQQVKLADAVHPPVPGDLGTIGILLSLFSKKRLFVRHCGRWGKKDTVADRFLKWLLERIAGGKNVVLATGASEALPSKKNPNIRWIFATSLSQQKIETLPITKPWQSGQRLKLITVGALNVVKNTTAIIEALPTISEHHPNLQLDVIGSGWLRDKLVQKASELGFAEQVVFHGNLPHESVFELLAGAHIFVFPSHSEGFPKALLEALACGLPVIASPVSVIPHLVGQGCGLLLEDTSPNAVADAVIKMAADPSAMRTMGKNARQVAEGYTLEKWRDQIRRELTAAWGKGLRVPCSNQEKING